MNFLVVKLTPLHVGLHHTAPCFIIFLLQHAPKCSILYTCLLLHGVTLLIVQYMYLVTVGIILEFNRDRFGELSILGFY